jgi:hypothetical protein
LHGLATATPTPAEQVPLFFGLDSSAAAYGYPNTFNTVPTGVRALGLWVGNPHRTGVSNPHYDNTAAQNLIIDQTEATVIVSSQLSVTPYWTGATATNQVLVLEFTKGSSAITVDALFLNTTATAISEATFDSVMAADTMAAGLALLGVTYTLETHSIPGAIAREADGALDRVCLSQSFNPAGSGQEVQMQKLAIRRLY